MGAVKNRIAWATVAFIALATLALPASAAHVMQSIPLHSPAGGFVRADSFVHDEASVYLAGGFSGEVDFNPNGAPSFHTSTCPTMNGCSFVARYDAAMQLEWIDVFYASGDAADQRLAARTGGGVYLLLDFAADFAYRPNETQPFYHAAEISDVAIVALDGGGAYAGSAQLGESGSNALHDSRAFEIAPGFVDFAWSHQVFPLAENVGVASIARADMLSGVVSAPWIQIVAPETFGVVAIRDQRADATGRYVCGEFYGTVDFDALHAHRVETATTSGGADAWVARYDASGALVWLSIVTTDFFAECYGLAISGEGALWIAGDFSGSGEVRTDIDPEPVEIVSRGYSDALLLAYEPDGALISHAQFGGDADTAVYLDRIEAASEGSLVVTGVIFYGDTLYDFAGDVLVHDSDYENAFVIVVAPSLETRYFGPIGYAGGSTTENTLQLPGPSQYETVVQASRRADGDALLNYALPPEQAPLLNEGMWASAYVRYDFDALLENGFDGL